MLDNLNFELFEWFLLRAKQQHEEETIMLLRLIELLYTNEFVFPDSWLQFLINKWKNRLLSFGIDKLTIGLNDANAVADNTDQVLIEINIFNNNK